MNTTIRSLDQLESADESYAGGKAFNCARLRQAGFPVPDGLVVMTTATNDDLSTLTSHPWFESLPSNTLFAVRSSGIGEDGKEQSFAGIHETQLNVGRADIYRAVLACRASSRSAQALAYRHARGISPRDTQTAVLIQCMIRPVAAGVGFTVNPVTGADDHLVINSSWGLGHAVVDGRLDPDEFCVCKRDGQLVSSRLGDKGESGASSRSSLTPSQVQELAGTLIAIERHYGTPQDVEWCHDGARFWIVQSRPVTTSRDRAAETEWTRANLAEVLPDLTSPQALSALEDVLNRAERQFMGRLMAPEEALGPMVKSFGGRLYFNLSQLRRVCMMGGMAHAMMLRSMGHAAEITQADEKPVRPPVGEWLSTVPDLVRLLGRHARAARLLRTHEKRINDFLSRLSALDPQALSDADVWHAIEEWLREAPGAIQIVLLFGGVLFQEIPLRKICARVGYPFDRLVYPQLATGGRSVSTQQAFDLVRLADIAHREPAAAQALTEGPAEVSAVRKTLSGTTFLAEFERFLDKYGHRGRYESDWALPRYSEDPTPLLLAIRAHLHEHSAADPSLTEARQAREAADAWRAFEEQLTPWQKWTMVPRVRRAIRRIKQYYVWREHCRSEMTRILAEVRKWHLVLADRFVERGWLDSRDQYFLLHLPEVAQAIEDEAAARRLRAIATDRAAEMARYRSIDMPLLMRESELSALIRTAHVSGQGNDESQLRGLAVSRGCVEADVVVLRDPGDFHRMKRGAILVARATDASWTPLFTLASGVIVEVGGVLSHASTIAREYGLPALANVRNATRRLTTGERVRLDATIGVVHRLGQVSAISKAAM